MPEEAPPEQVPDDTGGGEDSPSAARDAASKQAKQAKQAGADEANEAGGEATGNPKNAG